MKIMSSDSYYSDDSISSCHSDKIHSDIEAELYSIVHHQESALKETQACYSGVENIVPENSSCKENYRSDETDNNVLYTDFETSLTDSHHEKQSEKNPLLDINITPTNLMRNQVNTAHKNKVGSRSVHESVNSARGLKASKFVNSISQAVTSMCNKDSFKNTLDEVTLKKRKVLSVESSGSDSDSSVILIDEDCDDLGNTSIKTNLSNDMSSSICDSSNDSFSLGSKKECFKNLKPEFSPDIFFRQNVSMPNIKLGENVEDLWHVDIEDLYRSNKFTGRYHERSLLSCSTCRQKGHTAKTCKVPKVLKCYICGGKHISARCQNKICPRCWQGHRKRHCSCISTNFCFHCNMKGHVVKDCPDMWRRYHLTTNNSKIIKGKKMKQDTPIYCFNCGSEGHFGGECREPRMDNSCFPTWPLVISYDKPFKNFNESKKIRYQQNSFQRMQNVNQCTASQEKLGRRNAGKKKKKRKVVASLENIRNAQEPYFPRTPRSRKIDSQIYETMQNPSLDEIKDIWKARRSNRKNYKKFIAKFKGGRR